MPPQATHIMWIKLHYHHLRRKLESYMEKWKIADLANLKCKDRNHYNSCLICQCCWLLCTSYVDIQSNRIMWRLKMWRNNRINIYIYIYIYIFAFNLESSCVRKEYEFYKLNITACTNVYFSKLCLQSIGGNSVDINGPSTWLHKHF
jgi:hypothetical protein